MGNHGKPARLYVAQDEGGQIKLGLSRDPIMRVRNLCAERQCKVELLYETDELFDNAWQIEQLAHRVLGLHGRHIRGEWFESSKEFAVQAINMAIRQAQGDELELGANIKTRPGNCSVRKRTLGPTVTVCTALPQQLHTEIKILAVKENRKMPNMVRVLLAEALEARQQEGQ